MPQGAAHGTGDSRAALSFCYSGLYVFNTRIWGGGSDAAVAEPARRRGSQAIWQRRVGCPSACVAGRCTLEKAAAQGGRQAQARGMITP